MSDDERRKGIKWKNPIEPLPNQSENNPEDKGDSPSIRGIRWKRQEIEPFDPLAKSAKTDKPRPR